MTKRGSLALLALIAGLAIAFPGAASEVSSVAALVCNGPAPKINAAGPTEFCEGGSVTLRVAGKAAAYEWFNGATSVGTTAEITVTTSGSYTVKITEADGCTSVSAAEVVTVNPLPAAVITADGSTNICGTGSVKLTASAGASYQWFQGQKRLGTTQSVNVTESGSYTVEVTSDKGCSATSTPTVVTVTPVAAPVVSADGPTTFCSGKSVKLTSTASSSYEWLNGTTVVGTTQSITVSADGSYAVRTKDANGCIAASDPVVVKVHELKQPSIDGAESVCAGGSVTLDAGKGYATYSWSNGATTQTITVSPAATTTYTVTVANAQGCSIDASKTVTVISGSTSIEAPASVTAKSKGNVASVAAGATGTTYAWTITGGTITQGQGTNRITFDAGTDSSIALGVTVASGTCSATGAASISVTAAAPTDADLAVAVAASAASAAPGGAITFTIDATNHGPVAASNVVLVADFSGGTSVGNVSPATWTCTTTGKKVTCRSATAAVGAMPTVTIAVTAPTAVGTLTASVEISSDTADPNLQNNTASASVVVKDCSTAAAPQLTAPADGATNVSSPVTFRWTPVTGATQYELWLAVDGAAASLAGSTASTSLTTSVTGKNVIWSVKALFDGCPASASAQRSFAVEQLPTCDQAAPQLIAPADGATGVESPVTFRWSPVQGATLYEVWLSVDGAAATLAGTSTGNSLSVAVNGKNATWSVAARFDGCPTKTSAQRSFAVAQVPTCDQAAPQLSAPADGATGVESPVTFRWSPVQGATLYEVWLSVDGAAATLAGTSTGNSLSVAVNGKNATWFVAARFDGCPTKTSAQRSFAIAQVVTCDQAAPVGTLPAAGASVQSPASFAWTDVGAVRYRVRISIGGGAEQEIGTTTGTTLDHVSVPAGTISWTVEAQFAGNCPAKRSAAMTFTVAASDPCAGHSAASLIAPAAGATAASAQVEFRWESAAGATGYRLWTSTNGAAPVALTTTPNRTFNASLASGQIDWFVETLFDGCASVESEHRTLTVPQPVSCGNGNPALLAPSDGIKVTSPSVTFTWSSVADATGYELWLSLDKAAPVLIGSTTGTSLTREVAAGELEWFVRALFNGCPSRDSQKARLKYEQPPACADVSPQPVSPANNEANVFSPVNFVWKPVTGATGYKLWASIDGGTPQLVASTASAHHQNAALDPGQIDWYVEALLASCPPLRSAASRFTVSAKPQGCVTPAQPVIVAAASASSDVQYAVRWQRAAGATSYQVQESANPDFSGASSDNVTSESVEYVHTNGGSEPLRFHYRVRALSNCTTEQSAWSSMAVVIILPATPSAAQQLQGSTPAEAAQTITYTIPLDASLAGLSFTATPNEPWLSVTPASGVVPPAGMTLTVVAQTNGLPIGTSVGGITINTASAAAGRANVTGGGTTTTTVSVNLVQPVLPTPKNTPPPDALIIPAVAHADGLNSKFQSDVRVTNTAPQVVKYQLTFTPSGEGGMKESRQTSIDIEPGRTVALDDILGTWFNAASKSLIGTLEVRPLTQLGGGMAASAANGRFTFASSRTFNATANGTFGQQVPAIPFANFIGGSSDPARQTALSLQQIAQSSSYRTNLGLIEASGTPATAMVKVFSNAGAKVAEFPVQLNGGQHLQMNAFLAERGVQLDDGRVEVRVTSSGGRVSAYASVIDNATNDPLMVSPVTVGATASSRYVLPGVADLQNGIANWQTDTRIFNSSSKPVTATLAYYAQGSADPKTAQMTIGPNEVKALDSTLKSVFGLSNSGGALHISTDQPASLVATARTYNLTTAGTFGQAVSAVTPAEAAGIDSRPLQILQVEESSRYRTNIGVAEVSGKAAKVMVAIVPPDGRTTAVMEMDLAPYEFRQVSSMLRAAGVTNAYNARVTVKVVGGSGRVTAYASVIDAVTQDPTFIAAQ